jgi:predicted esterase
MAVLLVHGRGGSPERMADLARILEKPNTAWLAPRAAHGTWYPNSFLAPIAQNQPWLDSALAALSLAVEELASEGIPSNRLVLLGFSQGACLVSEFVARNALPWGGLVALSGGLIGPPGTRRDYEGSVAGMPAFFGCGDPDPHVPRDRVEESGKVLAGLKAHTDVRFYPGLGHAVNEDEIEAVRSILEKLD